MLRWILKRKTKKNLMADGNKNIRREFFCYLFAKFMKKTCIVEASLMNKSREISVIVS